MSANEAATPEPSSTVVDPTAPREYAPLPWIADAWAVALTPVSILLTGFHFATSPQMALLPAIARSFDRGWLIADWQMSVPLSMVGAGGSWLAWLAFQTGPENAIFAATFLTRCFLLMGLARLAWALVPGHTVVVGLAMLLGPIFTGRVLGYAELAPAAWMPWALAMGAAAWVAGTAGAISSGARNWTTLGAAAGVGILAAPVPMLGVTVVAIVAAVVATGRGSIGHALWALAVALIVGLSGWLTAAREGLFSGFWDREMAQLMGFAEPWRFGAESRTGGDLLWALVMAVLCAGVVSGALRIMAATAAVGLLLTAMLGGASPFLLRFEVAMWSSLLLFVALTLAIGVLVQMQLPAGVWRPSPALGWGGAAAVGTLALIMLITVQARRDVQGFLTRVRTDHWASQRVPPDPARVELALWVRHNTTPEQVFAIPPSMEGFRMWESRPIVIDHGTVPRRPADMKDWAARVALGANVDPYIQGERMPATDAPTYQLILLAQNHGARFVVARERVDNPAVVFSNEVYTVIDLARSSVTGRE